VINVNMAAELKEITTQRGHDPRDFPLVVAGGAGPLHGAAIARELGIGRVIVPAQSSVLCALGMLTSDLKHDYVASYPSRLDEVDGEQVRGLFDELAQRGAKAFAAEGIPADGHRFELAADMRYEGQHHEITVPIQFDEVEADGFGEAAAAAFDRRHDELYGFNWAGAPIELLVLRVAALGRRPGGMPSLSAGGGAAEPRPKGARTMCLETAGADEEVPVYAEEEVGPGASFAGPAVVEGATTTILVPEDFRLERDALGSFALSARGEAGGVAAGAGAVEGVGR
jgi:N-methylhydantoinase A